MAKNASDLKAFVRTQDGSRFDFPKMGFELLTHDDEGKPLTVQKAGKEYAGAMILRVSDLDLAREYVLDEAILSALDGQSIRVGQQDVCRNYLVDCATRKVKPMAEVLEQRLWNRIIGERMKGGGGTRVVVRVTLPSGAIYEGDPTVEALGQAFVLDLVENFDLDADMAVMKVTKMTEDGKIAAMLAPPAPKQK